MALKPETKFLGAAAVLMAVVALAFPIYANTILRQDAQDDSTRRASAIFAEINQARRRLSELSLKVDVFAPAWTPRILGERSVANGTDAELCDLRDAVAEIAEHVRALKEVFHLKCKLIVGGSGELRDELFSADFYGRMIVDEEVSSHDRAKAFKNLSYLSEGRAYMHGLLPYWISAALEASAQDEQISLLAAVGTLGPDDVAVSIIEDFAMRSQFDGVRKFSLSVLSRVDGHERVWDVIRSAQYDASDEVRQKAKSLLLGAGR